MHDGRVAGVKIAAAECLLGRVLVVVVPLHHDVATRNDLAERGPVPGNVAHFFVDDPQVAGRHEFDSLPRLDPRAVTGFERIVLRQRRTDRNERRRLGEAVDLGDGPAELTFHAFDGGCCRRRACRRDTNSASQ
jgi:hypothetical protein